MYEPLDAIKKMKFSSVLLAILFGFTFYALGPLIAIKLNSPIISHPALFVVSIFSLVIGAYFFIHSINMFLTVGGGTPVPTDPPKTFVAVGLYRHVRNPMYIGHFLLLLSLFLYLGRIYLFYWWILIITSIHLFVVLYEEPNLRKKFGKSYEKYLVNVPRWLFRRNV